MPGDTPAPGDAGHDADGARTIRCRFCSEMLRLSAKLRSESVRLIDMVGQRSGEDSSSGPSSAMDRLNLLERRRPPQEGTGRAAAKSSCHLDWRAT